MDRICRLLFGQNSLIWIYLQVFDVLAKRKAFAEDHRFEITSIKRPCDIELAKGAVTPAFLAEVVGTC